MESKTFTIDDFAQKIGETFGMTPLAVAELFNIEEDKDGFFVAQRKPKQVLTSSQYETMRDLVRNLGGETCMMGMNPDNPHILSAAWKVPGPCAKDVEKPSNTQPIVVVPSLAKDDPSKISVDREALSLLLLEIQSGKAELRQFQAEMKKKR